MQGDNQCSEARRVSYVIELNKLNWPSEYQQMCQFSKIFPDWKVGPSETGNGTRTGNGVRGSRTPVTKIIGLLDQWFFSKAGTESEHAMDFKHARNSSDVGTIFGVVCCAADGRYWDFCG